ncbi:hypothetical protein J5N97_006526 [Dioscorea zingiberensis]|uniref:Apyrase 7 n=1 Tax=Dioscorea zingiberensis TaxID=325984 RepID=A0A9D5HST9_9LILI|nr:hypothetical protein J5N97_006526 [Dioscorea zingiberensis]
MRLSSSLQDLSTYSKVDIGNGSDLEKDRSYIHTKPLRLLQREGVASSFSKEKSLPTSPLIRKKWTRSIIFLLGILVLFSLIYVFSTYYSSLSNSSSRYHVILDCGSTSTRVYVYEWSVDRNALHGNLPIVLRSIPEGKLGKSTAQSGRAYQRMETEPGFHKLIYNETGLRGVIKPLLNWAEKQIPKHAHRSTPIFLYATAGVRKLPGSDSDWLLRKAWSILKKSSFLCQRDWVKIISGMEEAYYGWIALNYRTGMLGSPPTKGTFGALDLGGSSLQVTFETEKPISHESGINLSIGTMNHHLSAYSLSGYGLNDAFEKSVVHLLKQLSGTSAFGFNNGKIELSHPCLQTGYREQYSCSQCAAVSQEGSPLIGGRAVGKEQSGTTIELIGAPQWEECSALAKIAVNLSEWSNINPGIDCELKPCALSDSLPRPHGMFYAMSGFFVVFRFFNLSSEATLNDVLRLGQRFCEMPWEAAKNSVVPQPFIQQYCFRAPYIVSLLKDGLHISDNQVVIGSGSITWTLGVALLQAGQALSGRIQLHGLRILHTEVNPIILLVMVSASLLLLCCALSCVINCWPRFVRRQYLPLFKHNSAATSKLNIPSPFRFQRWSPMNSGDGRGKMPLSPTVAGSEQHPFGMGHGFGASSLQLVESSSHAVGAGVSHSFSSSSLGQMQFSNGAGSFWAPHRGQSTLQSRRSQSREDLVSSLAESHNPKV